ncbi:hypothetical protein Tco_1101591 [Tanacetum coccineum]
MTSMNTRLNIEKLDGNIVQKHGGFHGVQDEKRVWFEVELQGAQGDREAEVFQVSNDDTAVAQRRLKDKQSEEKTNTDCLVKDQEKVHLGIKVGANITVTGVPGQEGAEGNVAEKKKLKESMKANLRKLLKYKACLTRRSSGTKGNLLKGKFVSFREMITSQLQGKLWLYDEVRVDTCRFKEKDKVESGTEETKPQVVASDEDSTDQEEDLHEASSDNEEDLYEDSSDQEEFYDEDSSDLEEYLGLFDETDQEEDLGEDDTAKLRDDGWV